MTARNVEFDDLLARLATLSSRGGLVSRDIRNLADGFYRLDRPLTTIWMARGDVTIDPTDANLIDDEWVALRDVTRSAIQDLEAGYSQAETAPSIVWSKVSFIKARLRADKLHVLVDSVLRHPRPGWESSEIRDIRQRGYREAEDKYHGALNSVGDGSPNPELTPPQTPTIAQVTPQMVPGERGSGNTVRSERLDQQNLLNALRTAHRAIDKLKLDRIQELETSDFQGAETICRELIRLEEDRAAMGPGVTDDTTILEYKDKLAELLMSQRRYIEAEVIARDMRREWERLRGETSKPARTSLLQLCRALRGPKPVESYRMKYIEAEEIHRRIWWFSREESDKYWRVQNGYEFALVIAEQNRCKEAVVVYGEVMQAERAIADIQPDERSAILDSRHKLGEILCREREFDDAASILKLVWEERRSIVTGEALATSLGKLAKWEEEENVWRWLCEARRRDPGLPEDDPKLIEYRLNYGKVLLKRKNFAASVIQFRQTLDRRNQERLNADDCENLHCYCQAQVGNGEYAAAEGVIRKVWQKRQLILPDRDRDKCTMESCHLYGVVLLRRRRFQAAENILSQVSNLRRVHNGADHVDTLESSLEYGNSLREQNDTDKWLAARNVFLEAWNFRDLHSIRAQPAIAYDTILEIGCSLARTMRNLGAYPQARSLMEDVLDRKRVQLQVDQLDNRHPFSVAMLEMQRPGIAAPPPGNGGTPPGQEEPGSVEVVEVESEESTGKHGGKKKKKVKDGKKGKSGKKGKDETKGKDGSKGKDGTKRKGETRRSRYPLQIGVQLEVSGG